MTLEFAAAHFAACHPGRDVTAIGVGAYDGFTNDPLAVVLERHGWRGVLVEPQPEPFAMLRNRYAENPRVQTFNVAIGDRDGTRALYRIPPAEDLPVWTQRIASFDRAHVVEFQSYVPSGVDIAERIVEHTVECWTFDTLLRRADAAHVDLLQIDAEGFDFELLRLFDIPRRLPAIVNYEHEHLPRTDRNAAAELLVASGYQLAMNYTGRDTVGYRHADSTRS